MRGAGRQREGIAPTAEVAHSVAHSGRAATSTKTAGTPQAAVRAHADAIQSGSGPNPASVSEAAAQDGAHPAEKKCLNVHYHRVAEAHPDSSL